MIKKILNRFLAFVRKVMRFLVKALAVIFLIYLVVTLVLLPTVGRLAIAHYGSKIINQELSIGKILFNPFDLRLIVGEFSIQSPDKKFIEFENFSADLSALSLFKKEIRIESVTIDALVINAVLLSDLSIDLMQLVPETPEKTDKSSKKASGELPLIKLDLFEIRNSKISFTDQSIGVGYKTALENISLKLSNFTTQPEDITSIRFTTNIAEQSGQIGTELQVKPFALPIEVELFFNIRNYSLDTLTPYVGRYTGNEVQQGRLNLRVDTKVSQNKIRSSHKLEIKNFDFGKKYESEDALNLPFGLAVGLLEDSSKRIKISLPVKGDLTEPDFEYWPLVGQVARNFFIKIITKPFSVLASLVGGDSSYSEDLSYVRFLPGSTILLDEEKDKIKILSKTLNERPKLALQIIGSYDPVLDWEGLKKNNVEKLFAKLKKRTGKSDYDVIVGLHQKTFGLYESWNIIKEHNEEKAGENDQDIIKVLRQRLIEKSPADKDALVPLAKERAKAMFDYFVLQGFDKNRLSIAPVQSVQSSMGYIPSQFTLKIKDSAATADATADEEKVGFN